MRINTNVAALNSYNQLNKTQNNLSKSLERLSSGKRINGAADDAAGLAISEKMNSQTRGLAQAQRNAQDGISMIQTAEGALKESHSILQRMRELSVQAANDTNTADDRAEIQNEINQLTDELDRIGDTTEFNTQKLLDGSLGAKKVPGTDNAAVLSSELGDESAASMDFAGAPAATLNSYDGEEASVQVDGAQITFDTDAADYTAFSDGSNVDTEGLAGQLETDINAAIDEYNSKNDTSIGNVSVEASSAQDGTLTVESGSTGETSTIKIESGASGSTNLWKALGQSNDTTYDAQGLEGEFSAAGAAGAASITDGMTVTAEEVDFGGGTGNTFDIALDLGASNADYEDDITIDFAASGGSESASWTGDTLTITLDDTGSYTDTQLESLIAGSQDTAPEGIVASDISATIYKGGTTTGTSIATADMDNGGTLANATDHTISGGTDTSNVSIDGTQINVNWANAGANPPAKGNDMTAFAGHIESDINNAIADYNDTVDSEDRLEDVAVTVKDGSFQVQSGSEDVTSSIKFDDSGAAELLGLADQSSSTQGGGLQFQIGANQDQSMRINVSDMRSESLEVNELDVTTQDGANDAIETIDNAISKVSSQRSSLGAYQNRLDHTINNLNTSEENLTAAESRISDVDMAKEMMSFTKNQILSQAGTAMMAQANQLPQGVLQLLQ